MSNRYWFRHVVPPSWNGIKIVPSSWEGWLALAALLTAGITGAISLGRVDPIWGPIVAIGAMFAVTALLVWQRTDHTTSIYTLRDTP